MCLSCAIKKLDNPRKICENGRKLNMIGANLPQILVLHGPNLNLLGTREPGIYGAATLANIDSELNAQASKQGVSLECKQTNHEGALVDMIQDASTNKVEFIILNAGAFTHTSVSIRDALLATQIPFVELHISNPYKREDFRKQSYLADIAYGIICGLGTYGYQLALQAAMEFLNNKSNE